MSLASIEFACSSCGSMVAADRLPEDRIGPCCSDEPTWWDRMFPGWGKPPAGEQLSIYGAAQMMEIGRLEPVLIPIAVVRVCQRCSFPLEVDQAGLCAECAPEVTPCH